MATALRLTLLLWLMVGLPGCAETEPQQTTPPTCTDGALNGSESDIDCGGETCVLCESGRTCASDSDCATSLCDAGVCACPEGQQPDPVAGCADLDECAEGLDDCDASAQCVNTDPGFTCTCPTGTVMSGDVCEVCPPGQFGEACAETCGLGDCASAPSCDPVTGEVTACGSCPEGMWGDRCDTSCDAGNCIGQVTCDETDGTVLACDDGCVPGFFGPVCDTPCEDDACIACNHPDACDDGSVCTDGICMLDLGQTCADNDVCVDVCVANTCANPSNTSMPCDTSDDCAEPGIHECSDGVCLLTDGTTCDYDDECTGTCLAGLCAPISGTGAGCDTVDDCDEGHDCEDARCLRVDGATCQADADCSNLCVHNVCAPPSDLFGDCDTTSDCLGGLTCPAGTCLLSDGTSCDTDEVCDGTCVRSVCAPRSPTQAACDDTADCEQLHACTNDQCLRIDDITCGENNDCINVCINDTCSPRAEIGGVCDDDQDCVTGSSCVDDVCLFNDGQQCTTNDQCASACINDVCQDRSDTGGPCDERPDCVDAHACIAGTCLAEDDEDCDVNANCVNVCITDTCAPQSDLFGTCDEDDDCVTGHVCDGNGVCKLAEGGACVDALDCATINTECVSGSCLTDAIPDPFSFTNNTCVTPSSDVTSNTATLRGFYGPLDLSVTGDASATLQINGVPTVDNPATVTAEDTVTLQVTAPSTEQASTATTVSIGGLERTWTVSTAPNIAPGEQVASESDVMGTHANSATGATFTVPVSAVYNVATYMQCRDRIHNGEYSYTLCSARLERLVNGSWSSLVGHSHTNGQCCTSQGWVLNRSTTTTLSAGTSYRFRYFASGRTGGQTTIYGSSASVSFQTCQ